MRHEDEQLEATSASASSTAYAIPRRFERVRVKLHIRVQHKLNGNLVISDGQAQDVSEGGIGTYIPAEFHVGECVKIEVVLPFGKRPIVFDAEVRDCNGFRYGFEFVNVKDVDRDELRSSLAAFATPQ
jgi:hypothetical protein